MAVFILGQRLIHHGGQVAARFEHGCKMFVSPASFRDFTNQDLEQQEIGEQVFHVVHKDADPFQVGGNPFGINADFAAQAFHERDQGGGLAGEEVLEVVVGDFQERAGIDCLNRG